MSGGVDSALTAVLLTRAGYECVGINMRTYHPAGADLAGGRQFQSCCSPEDASDARAVAAAERFPFYVLDLEREFDDAVVKPFIADYLAGRTPNPCVLCNNRLKLGVLLDKAATWECEYVATGHYARVAANPATGRMELRRAADRAKDQTYYLFGLRQEQLRRLLCPLGEMTKPQVREAARLHGIAIHDKPDSQEICFVPGNDYRVFLRERVADGVLRPGKIVRRDGTVLGSHDGLANFTIGQRRGIGIAHSEPLYVVDLLPGENLVVVGTAEESLSDSLDCDRANWVAIPEPDSWFDAEAQIRYRSQPAPAEVEPLGNGRFRVRFREPQRAITPGQAVVFYRGDTVLGGAWITGAKSLHTGAPEDNGISG
jgi:tRNA-specific 2-thiouridylase